MNTGGLTPTVPALIRRLPGEGGDVFDAFLGYAIELGIELYPAQEESIFEIALGNHVIVNTPTGSGKSLVAAAAHFAALADGRRSVYTAPIKALVSEKFFALCREFGSERVGMITGDAAVNADAPIICCTQEVLANQALRDGTTTPYDVAIVDEFHFYGDPQRGWAWQVPLLEMPHTQFVLMSATLGDVEFFRRDLAERTGRPATIVRSSDRPVPLDFEYRTSSLHASVSSLLELDRAPIYLVHFTQREATEAAQNYLALDPLTRDEKDAVRAALRDFRFDSPIGKDLRRFITAGVGVHHAGLLPKYRLLVEKLAQDGLLKIICGTDTLGVGVNVPIRSVLFTKLCKYDGTGVRILSNREFAQIAGRAGRKGFDDRGDVWAQAPEHVVENLRLAARAEDTGKKKFVRKKQPDRGYAHWTEDTFERMVTGQPEVLHSQFAVNHQMVMNLLDRPLRTVRDGTGERREDGCDALKRLLTHNHEPRKRQRRHIRRSIAIYRSLVDADLLEFPDEPDEYGRKVRVAFDLHDEFALHQPLSLWAVEAIGRLPAARAARRAATERAVGTGRPDEQRSDRSDESPSGEDDLVHALDVVSVVEAVQENPGVVLAAQVERARTELLASMKADGIEYEERMERLAQVEYPKPNREWTYHDFDEFRLRHPWVGGDNVKPKSIVREMLERSLTFGEYVQDYGLKRSEGVLLRYLSDVYRGLVQNVPADARTTELLDIAAWLGAVIRQVDSSLIDEWERLLSPGDEPVEQPDPLRPAAALTTSIVDDERAFRVMVRNRLFEWVQHLAAGRYDAVAEHAHPESGIATADAVEAALSPFWDEFDEIVIDGSARAGDLFRYDHTTGTATQVILDPDDGREWRMDARVDLAGSREQRRAVVELLDIVSA